MCRSIKRLYYPTRVKLPVTVESVAVIEPQSERPPTTPEEVRAAALQFVRKISGYRVPSKTNAAVFERAVERIAADAEELLSSLR